MGYNAYAYVVIGQPIPSEKLFIKKKQKAFKHSHPESMKFCPETGKALWEEVLTFPDGSDIYSEKFAGLDVIRRSCEDNSVLYLGLAKKEPKFWIFGAELTKATLKVSEILNSLGLYDPKTFGIHPVLYESY